MKIARGASDGMTVMIRPPGPPSSQYSLPLREKVRRRVLGEEDGILPSRCGREPTPRMIEVRRSLARPFDVEFVASEQFETLLQSATPRTARKRRTMRARSDSATS